MAKRPRRMIYTLIVAQLLVFASVQAQQVQVFFISPADPGTRPIVRLYDEAKERIEVASYVITDLEIAAVLAKTSFRIPVAVLLDESQVFGNKFSQYWKLRDAKTQIRIMPSKVGQLTDEFGIIDGRRVYTGSGLLHTDFKASPKFANYLILDDRAAVERYVREFERLFKQSFSSK